MAERLSRCAAARSARIRTTPRRSRTWRWKSYVELSRHPRCVGIGEAGLDYHYDYSPRDVSQRVFRTHIAAARETGLPLVIHARDADDDMIAHPDATRWGRAPSRPCSTASRPGAELARVGVELGLYVSFSGILTFKRSRRHPRHRGGGAARPAARRDGCALPRAAAASGASATNRPMSLKRMKVLAAVKGIARATMADVTTRQFLSRCSPRRRLVPAEGRLREPDLHDPRLRLLGRRAARRQRLGRLRPRQIRATAAAAARSWSRREGPDGRTTRCWSTRRPTCATSSSART